MNKNPIFVTALIILFAGIFAILTTVVHAKSSHLLFSKKHSMTVTLKNEANIDISKDIISQIPQVKIIDIKYRDKEWSKMVNKMDLPNMENPFKNEFIIKTKKNADKDEIYNKIKAMDFVENVKYFSDTE